MTSDAPFATPFPNVARPVAVPVRDADRIVTIDVIRGVAVLGILLVNIEFFAFPWDLSHERFDASALPDKISLLLVGFFAQFKFISVFSTLFGMGLALQSKRAEDAGRPFAGLYARRLGVLLVFGLCHGLLLWYGDILWLYAVLGFVALACRNLSPRALLSIAIFVFLLPSLAVTGYGVLVPDDKPEGHSDVPPALPDVMTSQAAQDGQAASRPTTTRSVDTSAATTRPTSSPATQAAESSDSDELIALFPVLAEEERIYREGTFREILKLRAIEYLIVGAITIFVFGCRCMSLFFLGMAFVKLGLFDGTGRRRRAYLWLVIVGLVVGAPLQAVGTYLEATGQDTTWGVIGELTTQWIGSFGMSLAYMAGLALMCLIPKFLEALRPVAAVGRMALTNYLGHSIICSMIFYSYGLGLFGQVRHSFAIAIVFGIFAVQLIVSPIWLWRFRFGPFEWVWRSLTYWRVQPFVR